MMTNKRQFFRSTCKFLAAEFFILHILANVDGRDVKTTKRSDAAAPPPTVCYDTLGCFASDGDFYNETLRPFSMAPESPEKINTKFFLYTRTSGPTELRYNDTRTLGNFDAKKPTKVICHGFLAQVSTSEWMKMLKDSFLKTGDVNVILVDWSGGNKFPYSQAVSNSRVVGAVISRLIRWLENEAEADRTTFHLLGHSLGAHVAGYAGSGLKEGSRSIGRITGLDPAETDFENMPEIVRLDPTDASFVDVIHTDGEHMVLGTTTLQGGWGLKQPSGHVDFYPNGGKTQPGCHDSGFFRKLFGGALEEHITCDHGRASLLYAATLDNPELDYRGFECQDYEEFLKGNCLSCDGNKCARMGERANQWNQKGRKEIKMYLKTTRAAPFAINHFSARVTLSNTSNEVVFGTMNIRLWDKSGLTTDKMLIISEAVDLPPGSSHQSLVTDPQKVSDIGKVQIQWENQGYESWFVTKKIYVDVIEVFVAATQKKFIFYAGGQSLNSKADMTLSI